MSDDIVDRIEKDFPNFHQLLLTLLVSQYVQDPVPAALREYLADASPDRRAAANRELDAAADLFIANYGRLSEFVNYNLESEEEARTLLNELKRGLTEAA